MKVLQFDCYAVYIFAAYAPPHCHLRFTDGEEAIVALPNLKFLAGCADKLKKAVRAALLENIDFLCNKWDELN